MFQIWRANQLSRTKKHTKGYFDNFIHLPRSGIEPKVAVRNLKTHTRERDPPLIHETLWC